MNITQEGESAFERVGKMKETEWMNKGWEMSMSVIEMLTKEFPNDKMLGEEIRKLVNERKG